MTEGSEQPRTGWRERMSERHHDRKQRRAWRRERRKRSPQPHDAASRAESANYQGGFFKKD